MKSHISATIDHELVAALQSLRKRERRSLSNLIETALAEYLEKRQTSDAIVSSPGKFDGRFSRRETYARTRR